MARPLRLEYPGALYHITSRGNERKKIFLCDEDRELFLHLLSEVVEKHRWTCHAYCLMDNHYHLLIEIAKPDISEGISWLNGVYTQKINRSRDYSFKPERDDNGRVKKGVRPCIMH